MKKLVLALVLALAVPVVASAAGGKAFTQSNNVVNGTLGAATFSAPANTYVGFFSTCPYTGSLGTELSSGSSTNYARSSALAKGSGSWTYSAATYVGASQVSNAVQINMPANTSTTTSWAGICCWGLFDSSTSGQLYYWGYLNAVTPGASGTCSNAVVVTANGSNLYFPVGSLVIQEN